MNDRRLHVAVLTVVADWTGPRGRYVSGTTLRALLRKRGWRVEPDAVVAALRALEQAGYVEIHAASDDAIITLGARGYRVVSASRACAGRPSRHTPQPFTRRP